MAPVTPTIEGLTCKGCVLRQGFDKRLHTKRGVFQHLLWHRDSGHVVAGPLLDSFDPAHEGVREPVTAKARSAVRGNDVAPGDAGRPDKHRLGNAGHGRVIRKHL